MLAWPLRSWMVVTLAMTLGVLVGTLRSQDRAVVVPGMKVLLENAHVRVQFHDVAVGETVPMHSHPRYVAYVLAPYKARLRLVGGAEKLVDRKPGEVFWGEREPVHAHCRPSVMYLMHEGVYRDDAEGRLIEEVKKAAPSSQYPMTLWLEPQGPHAVHNLDPGPTRLLRVELKR